MTTHNPKPPVDPESEIAGLIVLAMSKAVIAISGDIKIKRETMASAIVGFTANFLAAIDDDRERRIMRQSIQNLMPIVLANRVSEEKKKRGVKQ